MTVILMKLVEACSSNNEPVIRDLIKRVAGKQELVHNNDICETLKETSYQLICKKKNSFFNINGTNNKGETAIYHCIRHNNLRTIRLLVEAGADLSCKSRVAVKKWNDSDFLWFQEPPIVSASRFNYVNILKYLLHIKPSCLEDAATLENFFINGLDLKGKTTALHYAAELGNFMMMKLLIDQGIDLNISDHEGFTPLHFVVRSENNEKENRKKCFEMLIEAGAELRPSTTSQLSPPELSLKLKNFTVFNFYLELNNKYDLSKNNSLEKCFTQKHPLFYMSFCNDFKLWINYVENGLPLSKNKYFVEHLEGITIKKQFPIMKILEKSLKTQNSLPIFLIYHGFPPQGLHFENNLSFLFLMMETPRFDCNFLLFFFIFNNYKLDREEWLLDDLDQLKSFMEKDAFEKIIKLKKKDFFKCSKYSNIYNHLSLCPRRLLLKVELIKFLRNPLRLDEICRASIRLQVFNSNGNRSIINSIQNLPIASNLKSYLLFHDFIKKEIINFQNCERILCTDFFVS